VDELLPSTDEECDEMKNIPYQEAMYLAQSIRQDIAHAVGLMSRFNTNYGRAHWSAVKQILRYLSKTRGAENVTVVACCSAAGHFIPPLVIYKGKRNKAEFADNLPPGSCVAMSDSSYITTDIFVQWLHHFNQHRVPGKLILLLDGHASHVNSIDVIDLAVSYNITMVCLPPHTTHYLQPLDRAFFKPLKVHYDNACRTFLSNHPGRQITKLQFGSLLSEAWGRAATPGTASNGFRACGIFPLNAAAIPDNAFMPSTASHTPTKTTPTTFAMLHPTPKISRARRPAANKTTQKAAVLTSPAYRRSFTDKLESSDNSKKATTERRRLFKAKKLATKKRVTGIRNLKFKPPVFRDRSPQTMLHQ